MTNLSMALEFLGKTITDHDPILSFLIHNLSPDHAKNDPKRHHAPADGQAWFKDYCLGPLVEGKAWFNQNVSQIKKKVVMNVQLKTVSSILLFRVVMPRGCGKENHHPTVVRNSPF